MSHIDKRRKRRIIQLGKSGDGRYHAQLIHDFMMDTLDLRIWDSKEQKESMFYNVPSSSGELFAAYRAIADVTQRELERLNEELKGGAR